MKGIRGRESAASRAVVIRDDDAEIIQRPKPPAELTPEERDEWVAICNAVPADYFAPATHMILAGYCRHVVLARHLWQMMQQIKAGPRKKFDMAHFALLVREHRKTETAICNTLRTLRLTHLSNYEHDRTRLPAETPKPWLS